MASDAQREIPRPSPLVRRGLFALLLIGFAGSPAVGDSIWLGDPKDKPLFANARITRAEGGNLYFLINGNETSRELSRVTRISIDDQPALSSAEEAFAAGRWDDAVDGYERVARSAVKPWIAEWARTRLVQAAGKSGRFDAAVNAYIAQVLKDPTTASARPPLPEAGSTYLDTAVAQLNQALANTRLTDAQRTVLLSFLIEVHGARKDEASANAAAEKLDDLLARDPNNPAAAKAAARRKLQSAAKAIESRRFTAAVGEIEANQGLFVEPEQRAEAMYLLAEAAFGNARASKSETDLKDAALAYMRVVAHFRESAGQPFVPEALLRAGAVCEELNDRETAVRLYQEVARDYGARPPASLAKQSIERLGASK